MDARRTRCAGGAGSYSQIEDLIQALKDKGLVAATQGDTEAYLPARAIETILLRDIVSAAAPVDHRVSSFAAVQRTIEQIDSCRSDILGEQTLKDLVLEDRSLAAGWGPYAIWRGLKRYPPAIACVEERQDAKMI